jgi:hypothetical protein
VTKFEKQSHAARNEDLPKALGAKDGDRAKKQFQFLNDARALRIRAGKS